MILPWVGLLVSVFLATGPSYIYLPEYGEHISLQQLLPKQPRSLLPWSPPQVSPGPAGTDAGGHGQVSPDGEEDWRGPAGTAPAVEAGVGGGARSASHSLTFFFQDPWGLPCSCSAVREPCSLPIAIHYGETYNQM